MENVERQDTLPPKRSRWGFRSLLWAVPLALLLFVVVSDLFGWAYLRKPIASYLSSKLGRPVEIGPPFSIHLRPSIPIRVGSIHVAAPEWSKQPHFADVQNIEADLDWGVLIGRQPRLHRLSVAHADIHAERDAQGRASWSMGATDKKDADSGSIGLPVIEQLSLGEANIDVKDAANDLDMQLQARAGGGAAGVKTPSAGAGQTPPAGSAQTPATGGGQTLPSDLGLMVNGKGKWKSEAVSFDLKTRSAAAVLEGGALPDIEIKGKLGETELGFDGSVLDLGRFQNINGKVSAKGRSLGDLTTIPGLTLPATPPYRLEGDIQRSGSTIKVDVSRADVGSSSMVAKLEYDGSAATPMLRGTLSASRLVLQDLGPSIGTSGGGSGPAADGDKGANADKADKGRKGDKAAAEQPAGKAGSSRTQGAGRKAGQTGKPGAADQKADQKADTKAGTKADQSSRGDGGSRVLPSKEFDLPSLRAMNADVAIDLQKLDLGTEALRPLQSLKARLLLEGGVLKLQDLKSDLAGGTVTGATILDGSSKDGAPVFDAKLKWNRVNLKTWVAVAGDYFVAGRFSGETILKGSGKSTAAILQSLSGTVKGHIDGGSISHQIVELAGLDAAQALGVFFSGDKALQLSCALVDLSADKGTLRSNLFLLNTPDTIFFVQGTVNFRDERLDLRMVQSPKDWSPLSLRSPVTIGGTLGNPAIGVEPLPIAMKLIGSIVLASVTPLAALLPLIEFEDNNTREGCAPAIDQLKGRAADAAPESSSEADKAASKAAPKAPPVSTDQGTPPARADRARQPGRIAGERP